MAAIAHPPPMAGKVEDGNIPFSTGVNEVVSEGIENIVAGGCFVFQGEDVAFDKAKAMHQQLFLQIHIGHTAFESAELASIVVDAYQQRPFTAGGLGQGSAVAMNLASQIQGIEAQAGQGGRGTLQKVAAFDHGDGIYGIFPHEFKTASTQAASGGDSCHGRGFAQLGDGGNRLTSQWLNRSMGIRRLVQPMDYPINNEGCNSYVAVALK